MKLVRRFYTCVLSAVCGCTHVITMEDFVQTVDQHNHETINNVWYVGSKGKYDFFRHNTTLYSCTYKIYDGMADTTPRTHLSRRSMTCFISFMNSSGKRNSNHEAHCNCIDCTLLDEFGFFGITLKPYRSTI